MAVAAGLPVEPHRHLVNFYDGDAELAALAGGFVADGLRDGEAVIVVATPEHAAAFEAAVAGAGIDAAAVVEAGRLVVLDADDTLARFTGPDGADPALFHAVIGDLVRRAAARGGGVRVFGEMVALLWERGDVVGALDVENLWNALSDYADFTLLCAYPSAAVADDERATDLDHVCRLHSDVLGSGSRPVLDARRRDGESAERAFGCSPDTLRDARAFVASTLDGWGLDALVDDCRLVVTELGVNALTHAASEFAVVLTRDGDGVRIAVRDGDAGAPRLRRATLTAEGGRGLSMVAAVSAAWGHRLLDTGKIVWAEVRA